MHMLNQVEYFKYLKYLINKSKIGKEKAKYKVGKSKKVSSSLNLVW